MKRNAVWSGLEAGVSAVLSVLASFAVARIIGPAELGIGAAATAVHILLWVVVNALFADALVQRPAVNDRMLSSAFWASTAVGCFAMLLQAGSGWGLAWLLDDRRLVPMALVLAAPLPLVGGAGVIQGLLTRERAYRGLALRTLIGQSLGTATGIALAFAGAGGWALVLQQAVTSLFGALTLLLGRGWRPAWCLDAGAVQSLLKLGVPLTASTLVLIARYRLFAILIGGSAGSAVLGQVHIAFRLVDTVRELTFTALWRLMLPVLSEHQHDRAGMLIQVDRWLRGSVCVVFPLCAVLALLLIQVVALAMGPRWAAAGQAAGPLVGLMALSTLMFPSGVALIAVGKARFALYGNIAALLVGCSGAMVLRPADPWHAVMIWTVSQLIVCPYTMVVNARALGVSLLRPLSGGLWLRPKAKKVLAQLQILL
ncbi:oligosaccharide flippase family protein [Rhodopila sp.]|uniref:oligosaccharide flippase family protein n=1 Tax=Rhodopila sp. TaxID=2480087 RepID=UPI003D0E1F62